MSGAIVVAPAVTDIQGKGDKEAISAWKIGSHLFQQGCAVPELYGFDQESGLLVMEDLGTLSLYKKVRHLREKGAETELAPLYFGVLKKLVILQFYGRKSFQSSWCWDTPYYNRHLMLEKESGYFLEAWWKNFLGREAPQGIMEEFAVLADRAALAPIDFFLHRDCQSRNIFFVQGEPAFIDFQGGRWGPLGYDLASLLIDPYVILSQELQEELFMYYLTLIAEQGEKIPEKEFRFWYNDLALHRNLQIIGAFSFLSQKKGKVFFGQHIDRAVSQLRQRLQVPQFSEFKNLQTMVDFEVC